MIKLKRIKILTHFIDTTSQFVCSSHFEFQVPRSTGAGSGTKTFTGGLEAQQNFRKIRSLGENICHVLRNSKKIFRFLDYTAAAHVTITTAKKYLFEICDVKTSRFYKKRIGSLKSTFATQKLWIF